MLCHHLQPKPAPSFGGVAWRGEAVRPFRHASESGVGYEFRAEGWCKVLASSERHNAWACGDTEMLELCEARRNPKSCVELWNALGETVCKPST